MVVVHHRYATVDGHRLFFREAGAADAPTVVLLHGFPTSSHMFRHLIPALAADYRVVAPDHLGFGLSDAPSAARFDYTFNALADLTAALLRELGIDRYAMYVQDYGAPIGWRLALAEPQAITAIISQNGNAYDAGFVTDFWKTVWTYQSAQTPESEAAVRAFFTLEATQWQYLTGVADETLVDPECWHHDYDLLSRPGNDEIQLACSATTRRIRRCTRECTNISEPPGYRCWRCGAAATRSSGPRGAAAFATDLPDAEIHLLDGGHFLLESALDEAAPLVQKFLNRHLRGG
jgi:pimeloyl-ACP methyl ester carboxylesterase